jgi:hypothetical protein
MPSFPSRAALGPHPSSATMVHRRFLITLAAVLVTAFCAMPSDARAKKKTKYRAPETGTSLSLDGRNLGRARTCWSETFIYDGFGVPTGPYCH